MIPFQFEESHQVTMCEESLVLMDSGGVEILKN